MSDTVTISPEMTDAEIGDAIEPLIGYPLVVSRPGHGDVVTPPLDGAFVTVREGDDIDNRNGKVRLRFMDARGKYVWYLHEPLELRVNG